LFPPDAKLDVHVVIEQEPRWNNYISLSSTECDPFGYPTAALNWHVSDADATRLVTTTEAFLNSWNSCALSQLATVQLNLPSNPKRALAEGGGIFHPGGSIRIGDNRRSGVVDADLRTFQIPNLSVVSTATLPTGGAANPTMMLMMSAMRTADRLLRTSSG
jgi:choline dehydrogenase-like flavoprotein